METVRFWLNLSANKMLAYYRGAAQQNSVRACDGRRVQFPAQWPRRFVTTEGVTGLFELQLDRIGN